ncbi:MAG: hypothetical protein ACWGPR_08555 [Candidatus Deferrimicrobiaceae bacterium]
MSKKRTPGASDDAATDAEVRPEQDAQPPPELKTVDEWAKGSDEPAWKLNAARSLHRWAACEHHTAAPMRCTREDFDAALKAVEAPASNGHYAPHPPALFSLTRSADQ